LGLGFRANRTAKLSRVGRAFVAHLAGGEDSLELGCSETVALFADFRGVVARAPVLKRLGQKFVKMKNARKIRFFRSIFGLLNIVNIKD